MAQQYVFNPFTNNLDNTYVLPSLTSGSVIFFNGTDLAQDNSNLFWDATNHRLGIGTVSPSVPLDVNGATRIRNLSTGILHADSSGNLTSSLVVLTSEVSGILPVANGGTGVSSLGTLSDAGTDGIVVTGGANSVISNVSLAQHVADASHNGYLSSTDWSTFNGKQVAGNYITALTGDVTASGPGSVAATLASVNGNVGTFGSATSIPSFTVNAKGLITAASGNSIAARTTQVFTSGTSQTYTTPAGARSLYIRMVAGGGGAGGTGAGATNGGTGGTTTFGTFTVIGGGGSVAGTNVGAVGGSGGSGTAVVRVMGGAGSGAQASGFAISGPGGSTPLGAPTQQLSNGTATTKVAAVVGILYGSGAVGGPGDLATYNGTPGAGGGEYAEILINSPSGTYTYTVGVGGTAGALGGTGVAGAAGAAGIIIVEEYYQ